MEHEAATPSRVGGSCASTTARLLVVATLAVAGCNTMKVVSDYDHGARFSSVHTFAMIVRPHATTTDPLVEQRTYDAIRAELAAKGFTYVMNPAEADVAVAFMIGANDRLDVRSSPSPFGGPALHAAWAGSQMEVDQYEEGTLSIDVFDARTRRPIWHGSAKKKLSGSEVASSQPVIREAVAAVLADFPPKQPSDGEP